MKYHQEKKKTIVLEIISFFIFLFLVVIGVILIIQGDIRGVILYGIGVVLILLLVKVVHRDQDRFYRDKKTER